LLAVLYLFLTTGFTIATHFCGDTINSVNLVSSEADQEPEDCCGEPCSSDCCTTEVSSIKLSDLHKFEFRYEQKNFSIALIVYSEFERLSILNRAQFRPHQFANSPPAKPEYILNNVLLI
jgi:hypothetical protein